MSEHDANLPTPPQGQFLIYADGATQLQVRLEGNTVWLTQRLIAELYQVSVKTVNEHLVNIYSERELEPEATIRSFRIVQREGTRDVSRNIEHYSLDAILAVGYRVRSARGTAFRDTPGFAKHGYVLTPGRYVGAEDIEEDAEPFAEKYPRRVAEREKCLAEGERLAASVRSFLTTIEAADHE